MKKQILHTALAGMLFSFAFSSCSDYLDVEPNSGFTQEYVFGSVNEMRSAINGIYSRMTETNLYGQQIATGFNPNTDVEMSAVGSDVPNVNGSDIACYEPTQYWSSLNGTWNSMYQTINWANDVLEGIESSPLFDKDNLGANPEVAQMYGEAKCLRAVIYLDAIRIWGDVVFRTKSSDASQNFQVGVTDRNEILTYLIDELKVVEPYMSYAADMEEGVERASREFCQGLIGLLAMNRGGWTLRPDTDNPQNIGHMERADDYMAYYDTAIEYLGKVVNEGKHDLKQSFEDLWYNECNWRTAADDDILFSIPMLKGKSGVHASRVGVEIAEGSDYGRASQNLNLCVTYFYSFDHDDLRRDVTCCPVKYDEDLNQELILRRDEIAKWAPGKWSKLKMESPLGSGSFDGTGVNYTWMRFADVLLLYAEALNEKHNGPTEEAREALKRVRRRAFNSEKWGEKVDQYADRLASHDEFFQAIMDERAWEFGGEGIRKFDLARWNKYNEVIYNLYHTLKDWALVATGSSIPDIDKVPEEIYFKEIDDPEHGGRKILDIRFFDENGEIQTSKPEGYETYDDYGFVRSWYQLDQETGQMEFSDKLKYSFRGFININNESSVQPTDPLRYLAPYPNKVITDHRGAIKNYYGFN